MTAVAVVFAVGIVVGRECFPTLAWLFWTLLSTGSLAVAIFFSRKPTAQSLCLFLCVFAIGGLRMVVDGNQDLEEQRYVKHENHMRSAIIERMNHLFEQAGATDEGGLVVAMSMGDKRNISRDLRADYSASGAAHVLALSGLHIGIVFFVFRLLSGGRRKSRLSGAGLLSEAFIIAAIWVYVYVVGMPPSAVRAATMVSIYELMSLQHRDKISLNVIGATAFIMLLIRPCDIYNIGFQLSFAAVVSIIISYSLFYSLLPKPQNRIVNYFWSLVCVSLAAQMGVAPLIAYHFGYVSLYAVFSSMVVIPCAFVIISLSVLLLVFLQVTPIASLIAIVLGRVAYGMNLCVSWIAERPGATIGPVSLNRMQVLMLYLAICCTFALLSLMRKKIKMMNKTS